jgi:hypothetical protein
MIPGLNPPDTRALLLQNSPYEAALNPTGVGTEPLSAELLLTAIGEPNLSNVMFAVLVTNSPLAPEVLTAALDMKPKLKAAEVTQLLGAQ